MDDNAIVSLYWERDERAIAETDSKYGRMLLALSRSVVENRQDAGECVNDSYLAAWNSMPDNRPTYLGGYMAKITRRLSINRGMRNGAKKRGGGEQTVPYEELENCIAKDADPAQWYNEGCLRQVLDRFLSDLSAEQRVIFVRRYFYSDELEAIALRTGKSVGAVKALLYRLRTTLRKYLSEVGL